MKSRLLFVTVILIAFFSGSLLSNAKQNEKPNRADAEKMLAQKRPWVVARATQGFTHYPGATMHPVLSGDQTGMLFDAGVEYVRLDYAGAPHVHYQKSETLIILEGRMYARVDGADLTLTAGDFLHIPPGNVHSFISDGKDSKWIILHHPGSSADPNPGSLPPEKLKDKKFIGEFFEANVPDFYLVPEAGYPYGIQPPDTSQNSP